MMIDAVMYGMIPSAKIAAPVSAPPENRSRNPIAPDAECFLRAVSDRKSTYGTGTYEPTRKMKMMKIVKKILFRRSGTRNMLRRRESPDMGLTTSCRRGSASVASGW